MTSATKFERPKRFTRMSDLKEVAVVEVIQVKRVVGQGVTDDPARHVLEFYDLEGHLLARQDPSSV